MLSAAVRKKNYSVENAMYFINQRKSTKILGGAETKKFFPLKMLDGGAIKNLL